MDRLVPDVAAPGVSILPYVLGLTGVSRHRLPGENPKDGVAPMSDGASGPGARIGGSGDPGAKRLPGVE